MRKRILVAIMLAGGLFLLAGCSASVGGIRQVSERSEKSNFADDTKVYETELVIEPSMAFHTLSIRSLRLDAGGLKLTLTGPADSVVWEQAFTAPETFQREMKLDLLAGKWILRIETIGATGGYDIFWRAASVP
jgi:hypothetical protein